eukprot:1220529-Rhodomonas_salina.2
MDLPGASCIAAGTHRPFKLRGFALFLHPRARNLQTLYSETDPFLRSHPRSSRRSPRVIPDRTHRRADWSYLAVLQAYTITPTLVALMLWVPVCLMLASRKTGGKKFKKVSDRF